MKFMCVLPFSLGLEERVKNVVRSKAWKFY